MVNLGALLQFANYLQRKMRLDEDVWWPCNLLCIAFMKTFFPSFLSISLGVLYMNCQTSAVFFVAIVYVYWSKNGIRRISSQMAPLSRAELPHLHASPISLTVYKLYVFIHVYFIYLQFIYSNYSLVNMTQNMTVCGGRYQVIVEEEAMAVHKEQARTALKRVRNESAFLAKNQNL